MGSKLLVIPSARMSDGRIDNTKQLPNNLKGFTLEINALDAEMSQMVKTSN